MVSNVDRITATRRSRSRTPSRVATPQVKKTEKSKPARKKPVARTTRARSKTPSRSITTSTPKPSSAKPSTSKSSATPTPKQRKRKSIVLNSDNSDDDVDYKVSPTKKTKSPKTVASASKKIGRPRKSLTNDNTETDGNVRRSRRIKDLNSIIEITESGTKSRRSLTINGGVNTPGSNASRSSTSLQQNETLVGNESTEETGRKWGWFSCAIM